MISPVVQQHAARIAQAAAQNTLHSLGCAVSGVAFAVLSKAMYSQSNVRQALVNSFAAATLAGGAFYTLKNQSAAIAYGVIVLTASTVAQALLFAGSQLAKMPTSEATVPAAVLNAVQSKGFALNEDGETHAAQVAAFIDTLEIAEDLKQITTALRRFCEILRLNGDPSVSPEATMNIPDILNSLEKRVRIYSDECGKRFTAINDCIKDLAKLTEFNTSDGRFARLSIYKKLEAVMKATEQKIAELKGQITSGSSDAAAADTGESETTRPALEDLESRLQAAQEQLASHEAATKELESNLRVDIARLTEQLQAKEAELADAQEQLASQGEAAAELESNLRADIARLTEQLQAKDTALTDAQAQLASQGEAAAEGEAASPSKDELESNLQASREEVALLTEQLQAKEAELADAQAQLTSRGEAAAAGGVEAAFDKDALKAELSGISEHWNRVKKPNKETLQKILAKIYETLGLKVEEA